jgi:hypothetical protein
MGKLGTDEVPPGGSTEVTMEFKPESMSEMFHQSAVIYTNDPEMPAIGLSVEGQVLPLVASIPEGAWTIGVIREDGPTTFSGRVLSPFHKDFQLVSITPSQDYIRVSAGPLGPEQALPVADAGGYELKCEIEPRMPVGPFQETITVVTDIPEAEPLIFTVSGNRPGPFTILAPEWYPSRSLLRLGRFPARDGKKLTMSLFVAAREQPLELAGYTSSPEILQASMVKDEAFVTQDRERYLLTIEVPPGTTPGRWHDGEAVQLALRFNDAEHDQLRLVVELQAD